MHKKKQYMIDEHDGWAMGYKFMASHASPYYCHLCTIQNNKVSTIDLLWNTNWKEVLKFKGRNLDPLPAPPPPHRRDRHMKNCCITDVTDAQTWQTHEKLLDHRRDGHHRPWQTSTMGITYRDGFFKLIFN